MTHWQDDAATPASDTVELLLPNDATAPGQARRSVRHTLTRWRLPALIESCVLAVSELVTNALRHGRPPIGMLLRRLRDDVLLEVRDGDPRPVVHPTGENADELAESGRGLDIVEAVSDDSGSEHIPGDGKTAFASWHIEP